MLGRMGPGEIALIFFIIIVVFGIGKLPDIGGAIGKGVRSFRMGVKDETEKNNEEFSNSKESINRH